MNENNKLISYWLRANEDAHGNFDGTYSLEIETGAYTVNYTKLNVKFIGNQIMMFPVAAECVNEKGETIFVMDLTSQGSDPDVNNSQDNNAKQDV